MSAGYALDVFEMLKGGDALLQQGDMQGAMSAYSNAIAADPKSKVAYTKRATASTGLGHLHAAARDYSSALDIEPTSVSARLHRAQLYLRMCKFDDAEQDFNTVLEAKPEHDGAKDGKEKVTSGRGHLQTAQVRYFLLLSLHLCVRPDEGTSCSRVLNTQAWSSMPFPMVFWR